MMVLAGNIFILPFYLEIGKGLKPQHVGFLLMIYALMGMIVGPRAGQISDKIKPAILCAIAMLSATFACIFFSMTLHNNSLIPVIAFLFWYGISNALFLSPNNNLIMSLAPENKQGTASGVFNLFGRLSLVLGVSVFETIFSEVIPPAEGSLTGAAIPTDKLNHGFQTVYACASLLCFISLSVSVLTVMKKIRKPVKREWIQR
jgi:MFS family permease